MSSNRIPDPESPRELKRNCNRSDFPYRVIHVIVPSVIIMTYCTKNRVHILLFY